jgi:hypothetical protein
MSHRYASFSPVLAAALLAASPALALDGVGMAPPPEEGALLAAPQEGGSALAADASTYYEQTVASGEVLELGASESAAPAGLPPALYVVEAAGGVAYRATGAGAWQVAVEVAERPHERADLVYDLVLALALPSGFRTHQWRIDVQAGGAGDPVPVVYAGENVTLKRNVPLETSWLPLLVGAADGLPDVSASGYVWTFWDTIVRYDATAGSTLQGFGRLGYQADASVRAPDPGDPRNAAYVITWVPTLDAAVPPFALRLDVVEPQGE